MTTVPISRNELHLPHRGTTCAQCPLRALSAPPRPASAHTAPSRVPVADTGTETLLRSHYTETFNEGSEID